MVFGSLEGRLPWRICLHHLWAKQKAGCFVFSSAASSREAETRHACRQSKIPHLQGLEPRSGGARESIILPLENTLHELCAASPEDFIADIIRVHSKNSWFTYLTPPCLRAFVRASPSAQPRKAFSDRINRIWKIPPNHLPSKKNDFVALSPSALTDTPLQDGSRRQPLQFPLLAQGLLCIN